jgi:hypothetical protein
VRINSKTKLALVVLATAILLALPQPFARGEDDWDADSESPAVRNAAMRRGGFDVELNVNCWVCGNTDIAGAKRRAESMLNIRIVSLERTAGLSKEQAEKLRVAGRYDVTGFFRKVDAIKREFRGVDINDREFQQVWTKIQPLQAQFNAGLFNETSLFNKVLQGMLRRNPSPAYEKQELQRRQFRYRATIEVAVTMFESSMPLTDVQREKFVKVLLDETKPPTSIGSQPMYVVLYLASKLDEKKLKPIFDDAQWRSLSNAFRNARGFEQIIKSQGFVP